MKIFLACYRILCTCQPVYSSCVDTTAEFMPTKNSTEIIAIELQYVGLKLETLLVVTVCHLPMGKYMSHYTCKYIIHCCNLCVHACIMAPYTYHCTLYFGCHVGKVCTECFEVVRCLYIIHILKISVQ